MKHINQFFNGNFSKGHYMLDKRCFTDTRFGDFIAVMSIARFVKNFYPNTTFSFNCGTINGIQKYVKYFPDIISEKRGDPLPLWSGCFWNFYYYIHKIAKQENLDLNIPISIDRIVDDKEYIVINPMFDAGYDLDRNWQLIYFKNMYDDLEEFNEKLKLPIYIITPTKNDQRILKSFGYEGNMYTYQESISLVYHSTYYIGGNTGLTHMAAHSPYIKRMIEVARNEHLVDKRFTKENHKKMLFLKNLPLDVAKNYKYKSWCRCAGTNKNYLYSNEILCAKKKVISKFFTSNSSKLNKIN